MTRIRGSAASSISIRHGADALSAQALSLDSLHERVGAPVTTRRPWLEAWIRSHHDYDPVLFTVGDGGQLSAAAVLARRRRYGGFRFVAAGHGPSDEVWLPAVNDRAARALAALVDAYLTGLRRPWALVLDQLPAGDPVARELCARLPAATLVGGDGAPVTRFTVDRNPRAYINRNHHQQLRRTWNRALREGLDPRLTVTRDPLEIDALLPEIERICRVRDAALHRRSQFDDPSAAPFFHDVVRLHARQREVEVVTVHFGARLAAFTLSFIDGSAYRMWSCRFDPVWDRYGPGRLSNHEAFSQALATEGVTEFDWMRGDERYKFTYATHVIEHERLLAWSGRLVRPVMDARRAAKAALKPFVERHEGLRRARQHVARVFHRAGRHDCRR